MNTNSFEHLCQTYGLGYADAFKDRYDPPHIWTNGESANQMMAYKNAYESGYADGSKIKNKITHNPIAA